MQRALNPDYSGNQTHVDIQDIVRSDEHRSLGALLSDVSPIERIIKSDRGFVRLQMATDQEREMENEVFCISRSLQSERIMNIGLMGIYRYFVSRCKGEAGLTGGKRNTLLEYNKLCAVPKKEYLTIIFLVLEPVGGADLDFAEALDSGAPVKKTLVVGYAWLDKGVIRDVRYCFSGILIH
jgi:hypothetical protein